MLLIGLAIIDCTLRIDDRRHAEIHRSAATLHRRRATLHSIVKTLNRKRVIKGFYYDEDLCRPAMLLEGLATIDRTLRIDDRRRVETHHSAATIDCRPATNLVGPAAGTITPNPGRPCRQAPGPAPSRHQATPLWPADELVDLTLDDAIRVDLPQHRRAGLIWFVRFELTDVRHPALAVACPVSCTSRGQQPRNMDNRITLITTNKHIN